MENHTAEMESTEVERESIKKLKRGRLATKVGGVAISKSPLTEWGLQDYPMNCP